MIAVLVMVLATMSGDAGDPAAPPVTTRPASTAAAPAPQTPPVPSVPLLPAPPPAPAPELAPAAAPAPEALAGASLAPPELKRWYGWELLISDAAFVTLASRSHWRGNGMIGAGLGITLGTPLLHAINGNTDGWLWSTTGRSLAWVVAYLAALGTAAASSPQSCDSCTNDGPLFLAGAVLFVGGGIFLMIDDLHLAQKPVPAVHGRRVAFVPALAPTAGGATMGLAGVF